MPASTPAVRDRATGCLVGLALGDAMGAPTEFMSVATIRQRYGDGGPPAPSARVTDDTQMMLAVGKALLAAPRPYAPSTLEPELRQAFVEWAFGPDNDRAPGRTCMNACAKLRAGLPWHKATVAGSKGCGANMRVAPVGLLPETDAPGPARGAIAQFQAALTHGHPTGLAAADLTARAVCDLTAGGDAAGLPSRLRAYADAQRDVYHDRWLGTLWQQPGQSSPAAFIARGWDECIRILDRLDAALAKKDRDADPCRATGEGWIAEEAFGTGLLCSLLFPDDAPAAIRRGSVTAGDSDSIACLAGAFAGAHLGIDAWPAEWVERVEYRDRLAALGRAWDEAW